MLPSVSRLGSIVRRPKRGVALAKHTLSQVTDGIAQLELATTQIRDDIVAKDKEIAAATSAREILANEHAATTTFVTNVKKLFQAT